MIGNLNLLNMETNKNMINKLEKITKNNHILYHYLTKSPTFFPHLTKQPPKEPVVQP